MFLCPQNGKLLFSNAHFNIAQFMERQLLTRNIRIHAVQAPPPFGDDDENIDIEIDGNEEDS